jgi:hypothetical protein
MKQFTPIKLLPSGDIILNDNEVIIRGEEHVSVWRQEEKLMM